LTGDSNVLGGWLEAIIESADDAIISKTLDGTLTSWNKSAEKILGYTADEAIGQSVLMLIPEDRRDEETMILSNIRAGRRVEHFQTIRRTKDGRLIDVALTISPIKDVDGKIVGASKILRDITHLRQVEEERALVQKRLQEETEIVETINRIGALLSAELEQEKLVHIVTDAATELTGAEFGAFFYNVYDAQGGAYMLYALAGVPREKFEHFPLPHATQLFGPTFRGEATIRLDNVKNDPRYGKNPPYNGMPEGHLPVTSYLAVSVLSRDGSVIGGLFFGHHQEGVFNERHERIVEGLAGQIAIAMDNSRLYEQAREALRDREELLERERRAREEAEIASRAKDEFLGLLSHELRTPLNSILGWTRILISQHLDEEAAGQALETIDRNAKLQARLIDDMLDVSRIISGKLRLDAQPVDLTSVINAAVDTLRPAADAKQIRMYVTLDMGNATVLGDPVRLQQVVWNLVANAIKFMPKGGSVRVALRRVNSHVEITVSDTGPGIDPDFLPHVFERFRQADSATNKKFAGLGLGLSIVRHLVELHGGTVEAANGENGEGAVFTVNLPVMVVSRPIEEMKRPASSTAASGATSAGVTAADTTVKGSLAFDCPPDLQGLKVLAVDDEADSRALLKMLFETCGAEVQLAASTPEALEMLEKFNPDILVSDIGMPEHDGYSLIRQIREKEQSTGRRLPAVALTAFARTEDRFQALQAGYNMHVPKPVEPAELALVISRLVK
jgi:PAS domain S-box-containing protein